MKICYVDEAGCTGTIPDATSNIQPVLIIGGIIIDYGRLHYITDRLLNLKQRFFPGNAPAGTSHMGWMMHEVKGADLRKYACEGNRNVRRHRMLFLSEILTLCESVNAKLVGRVWVKKIAEPIRGTSIYTFSLQSIYTDFQNYLTKEDDVGFVIVDSRLKHLNTQVAHSIFTQKFKGTGDAYDRIIELPAFSHSDNHAGLQLIDIICSAILTPLAVHTYCNGHITSLHVRPGYEKLKAQFANRCRTLQHRYSEASGRMRGGLTISDGLAERGGGIMFK
jgi:Protein of unknown function (DUF3800)